jgi:hypothetical protein
MNIPKGTSVAIAVTHHWANLQWVRAFLRQKDDPNREIGASDDSHVIFAKVLDPEDPIGLWIKIDWRKEDGELEERKLLIPWHEVLTVVSGKSVEEQTRKIGF